jgi:hypothetical protein
MVNVPATYIGKQDANGGPLPDVPGILGHQDVPRDDGQPGWGGNYSHSDPGPTYDFNKLIAYIGNAPPPAPQYQIDGYDVGQGITQLVGTIADDSSNPRLRLLGKCMGPQHDEYLITAAPAPLNKRADPVVAVRFERGVLIWDKGRTPDPWGVRMPLTSEYVGPADDQLVQAVLKNMSLAGIQ